jgi:hypothetical protein
LVFIKDASGCSKPYYPMGNKRYEDCKADLTDYNTCLNNIKKAKDAEKEGKKEEEARKAAELKKIEDDKLAEEKKKE